MTTSKKTNKKAKGKHGGSRPGAGRPKKDRTPTPPPTGQTFETAEDYLTAVVCGQIEADPARIRAAGILIRFQESIKRVPKKSPTPNELDKRERAAEESANIHDFETKAREIRECHKRKKTNG